MKACCLEEARRSLARHRDVATCDGCGALLLAYEHERDYDATLAELSRYGVSCETATLGELQVIAKAR